MPDEHSTNHPDSKISGLSLQPSRTALISFTKYDGTDFSFDDDHRPRNSLTARYYRGEDVEGVRLPGPGSTKPIIPFMPDKPSNACFAMIEKDNKRAIRPFFLSNRSEPRPLTSAWSGMSSRGDQVRLVAAGFDGPTPTVLIPRPLNRIGSPYRTSDQGFRSALSRVANREHQTKGNGALDEAD